MENIKKKIYKKINFIKKVFKKNLIGLVYFLRHTYGDFRLMIFGFTNTSILIVFQEAVQRHIDLN